MEWIGFALYFLMALVALCFYRVIKIKQIRISVIFYSLI